MNGLLQSLSRLFERSTIGVTVPPMDGALKPNNNIEAAEVLCAYPRPDNLIRDGGGLLFSSGSRLLCTRMETGSDRIDEIACFASMITALASDGAGGIAAGLDDGTIEFGGTLAGRPAIMPKQSFAPTALVFGRHGQLFACSGSQTNRPSAWKRDLVERSASGSIWRFGPDLGDAVCLADGLAFPYGITPVGDDDAVLVSEAWKHRLILVGGRSLAAEADIRVVLDDLPGYPARIVAGSDGFWLCVFAPRGQLMEFVLREDEYRKRMIHTVPEEFWVAPSLSSGRSFLEPLQLGAIRTMGRLKPWAPTRSYGLLVRLDQRFQPVASAHSRSDGTRHGITSCVQWEDRILLASRGGDVILSLGVDEISGD